MSTTGSSDPRVLTLYLPPDLPLLNANDRIHYRSRSNITAELRKAGKKAAEAAGSMPFGRVRIRCIFRAANNRKRDVSNLYPSFKSVLDGIVDAKLIKDDNDKYVTEFCILRGENLPKRSQLIIQLIEVPDDDSGTGQAAQLFRAA